MSNGLQRGNGTGEEWFWRSFEHKDEERIIAAVSWMH